MVIKRKHLTKTTTTTKTELDQHATQNSKVNDIHAETPQVKIDNNNDLTWINANAARQLFLSFPTFANVHFILTILQMKGLQTKSMFRMLRVLNC